MSNINKTLWDKFVNYLKSSSPNTICEWNHHRELILRDDRSEKNMFLREIAHYNCNVQYHI